MTTSNELEITRLREVTLGITPSVSVGDTTKVRVKSESFKFTSDFIEDEEIRADRNLQDIVDTGGRVNGGFNGSSSFAAFDPEVESAMFNLYNETAVILNLTADTEISDVLDSTDTFTVLSGGTAFVANHLMRTSGFTNAANSDLFKVASSTTTTVVVDGAPTLTDETAPPAGARMKVVGFEGDSGDITATSTGLASTALDFTTLGLSVDQWINIGGADAVTKFDTTNNNDFVRITVIAANALTCDNLPVGFGVDAGAAKTIQVWVSDFIRNGKTTISHSYQTVTLGQDTPVHKVFNGNIVDTMIHNFASKSILDVDFTMLGFDEVNSDTTWDVTPTAAPQNKSLSSGSNVGRMSEGGVSIAGRNYVQSAQITISNGLREIADLRAKGLVDVGVGGASVTGQLVTYFGDKTIYEKFKNATDSAFNVITTDPTGKATIHTLPNVTFTDATSNVTARNTDVTVTMDFTAKATDASATAYTYQIDRFEEYVA